ncbi:2-hydroxychromene-2-carboxylate isomerase [Oleomonas cavernae]|uniref:2-hydroxychromene-2-carboxylate isomerase n=1 Tax=Oleomonas cavernae TaxID=2320859 RepID=A0A418WTD2_9PROT|nr:2-hydroxychromene-2-carboxylate isomerase [Oleomonas cavernae]RJF94533.1 2-hydroxychromene-2-carboxylate isomerase [Oleomonas cavernae]
MTHELEFLFDFGSPTTYLAHKRLPAVLARTPAKVTYVPILLGGVFKATGNQSPAMVPAKGMYMNKDLERFARRFGVTLNFNPYFPINTISLMRGAVSYLDTPRFMDYVDAIFDAMWLAPRNLGDPEVLNATLAQAGFDPADFAARINDGAVKQKLIANTQAAVERGTFGAPTFFVGEEMFFGQDRLDFVEEALAA